MTLTGPTTLSISIIIPVFNEEAAVGPCLDRLPRSPEVELLVVDGGSADATAAVVRARGLEPLISGPGRGSQQRAGAAAASGDIFLFLHCDTCLPPDFLAHIHSILSRDGVAAGAFRLRIDAPGMAYRLIEAGANLRSSLLGLPYGDQALFMRRAAYLAAGGFPDQPIMEDVALVRRLGAVALAPAAVTVSARRWQRLGPLRVTLINQLMLLGSAAGLSPQRLAGWYYSCTGGKAAGR
ncbi:MAG: TIGR04283 family arsenosugar biosynthesis glycosyltransferase [Candidatus Electronema sp. V4]|uniref:TIGR04283 family arsenosugar biosynthesis glycosyltransferase n=1 Tax=Candidatus Electronema sp. V4 TaxID=3454756 RepID=UPI0040553934